MTLLLRKLNVQHDDCACAGADRMDAARRSTRGLSRHEPARSAVLALRSEVQS